ncbi:hypothetical protein [[Scytonema hofmanni] UTEX B 1581]|uniref:hypothetical protein n=1 Tax=[Scytonema hofmanni] UTEX B 1581 TaxID=379535 RepID=UPI0004976C02|nr:hypothetical protein [[Scytonema hofmanni] UTEX B 1581]
MVCEIGDKPTIKYKFAGQSEKRYKSKFSPIEILQKSVPIPASDNYSPQGFGLRVWPVNVGQYVTGVVLDYEIFHNPSFPFYDTVSSIACGEKDYIVLNPTDCANANLQFAKCRANCYDIDPSKTVTIDNTVHCPVPMEEKCSLQILYNNLVIFQDQGNCPLEVEVICGDCPEGSIKCSHLKYPGYCCIPCKETANKINNLANKIR